MRDREKKKLSNRFAVVYDIRGAPVVSVVNDKPRHLSTSKENHRSRDKRKEVLYEPKRNSLPKKLIWNLVRNFQLQRRAGESIPLVVREIHSARNLKGWCENRRKRVTITKEKAQYDDQADESAQRNNGGIIHVAAR